MTHRSPIKYFAGGILAATAAFILGPSVLSHFANQTKDSSAILTRIQSLGDLHTARFNFESVGPYETWKNPAPWANHIPFASNVVHWATDNEIEAEYQGSVEAGVDLSQARLTKVGSGSMQRLVLLLPPVQIYKPQVSIRVDQHDFTHFWRDVNIAPKAIDYMQNQFEQDSIQSGIIQTAEQNAISKLNAFLKPMGIQNLEIKFAKSKVPSLT